MRDYWKLYYAAKKRSEAGKGRKYSLLAEKYYKLAQEQSELRRQSSTMMGIRLGVIKDEYNNPYDEPVYEGFYVLRNLRKGELFKRKMNARKVYVKGHYDRASKTFSVYDYEDVNSEMFAKGSLKVWAGFSY
jgi:hypothetical protein